MAIVPIEIFCIGQENIIPIENAIVILNKQQDIFNYSLIRNRKCESYLGEIENRYMTTEIYSLLNNIVLKIKGYHPHVIAVVNHRLDGKKFGNLFGSMQESDNKQLTGKAITSLWKIEQILHPIPLDVYLVFEFLSFAIRFVIGQGLIHDEKRMCFFDRKVYKPEIIGILKEAKFCEVCHELVSKLLDKDQMIAIDRIVSIINEISQSEEPEVFLKKKLKYNMARIFLSHSSNDKNFVEKLANDLANNGCRVWFDKWEIRIGDNIVERINSGISESDYLVFVISKCSVVSSWVMNEWTSMFIQAVNERKAKVLPILIDNCKIPSLLRAYKYADFRDSNNYKQSFEELLKSIRNGFPVTQK